MGADASSSRDQGLFASFRQSIYTVVLPKVTVCGAVVTFHCTIDTDSWTACIAVGAVSVTGLLAAGMANSWVSPIPPYNMTTRCPEAAEYAQENKSAVE